MHGRSDWEGLFYCSMVIVAVVYRICWVRTGRLLPDRGDTTVRIARNPGVVVVVL
jgi:hypothetical protein